MFRLKWTIANQNAQCCSFRKGQEKKSAGRDDLARKPYVQGYLSSSARLPPRWDPWDPWDPWPVTDLVGQVPRCPDN